MYSNIKFFLIIKRIPQSPLVFSFLEFLLLSTHKITRPTTTAMRTPTPMEAPIIIKLDEECSEIKK